jgi:hypothetical protein
VPSEAEWWKKQPGDDDWTGDGRGGGAASTSGGGGDAQREQQQRDGRGGHGGRGGRGGRNRGGGGDRGGARAARPWERSEHGSDRGDRGDRGRGRGGDDEEEGVGWWQIPREQREAELAGSGGLGELEAWQEERLVAAFAVGRRRVSVQQLAAELGLDRWGALGVVESEEGLGVQDWGGRCVHAAAHLCTSLVLRAQPAGRARSTNSPAPASKTKPARQVRGDPVVQGARGAAAGAARRARGAAGGADLGARRGRARAARRGGCGGCGEARGGGGRGGGQAARGGGRGGARGSG